MPSNFTILLEEDLSVDPRKYGDIVAPALGVTKVEARIAVRHGRGIFLEEIPEEHARRIVDELAKDGIAARAFDVARMPRLPVPKKTTHVERGQ